VRDPARGEKVLDHCDWSKQPPIGEQKQPEGLWVFNRPCGAVLPRLRCAADAPENDQSE
jgi:hypothetical protein